MTHPWHEVTPGEGLPGRFIAVIEIPEGSKVQYELDKHTGLLRADRILYSAVFCLTNYGFIPQTYAEDDPEYNGFQEAKELPPHRLAVLRRFVNNRARFAGLRARPSFGQQPGRKCRFALGGLSWSTTSGFSASGPPAGVFFSFSIGPAAESVHPPDEPAGVRQPKSASRNAFGAGLRPRRKGRPKGSSAVLA